MTSIKTAVCCILLPAILLVGIHARGQHHTPPDTLPKARWELTFSPLGLLEPPAAAGLGIGYRINKNFQLWSETSFLFGGLAYNKDTISGFRQLLQLRYYPNNMPNFFIGIEGRYKSLKLWEQDDFYNPTTQDTLLNFNNQAHRIFFGMACVVGWRLYCGRNKRFQIEATVGMGYKNNSDSYKGMPQGYMEHRFHALKMDDPFAQPIPGNYSGLYLPCTVRLVYLLRKIIKP